MCIESAEHVHYLEAWGYSLLIYALPYRGGITVWLFLKCIPGCMLIWYIDCCGIITLQASDQVLAQNSGICLCLILSREQMCRCMTFVSQKLLYCFPFDGGVWWRIPRWTFLMAVTLPFHAHLTCFNWQRTRSFNERKITTCQPLLVVIIQCIFIM